jgi:hypothetical protein
VNLQQGVKLFFKLINLVNYKLLEFSGMSVDGAELEAQLVLIHIQLAHFLSEHGLSLSHVLCLLLHLVEALLVGAISLQRESCLGYS